MIHTYLLSVTFFSNACDKEFTQDFRFFSLQNAQESALNVIKAEDVNAVCLTDGWTGEVLYSEHDGEVYIGR